MQEERELTVSVVVPVYMGEKHLRGLLAELSALRDRWMSSAAPMRLEEVIFVDDSARDGSPELLDRLAAETPWVSVLHLSRNFGQHPATIAGILHSAGDWIVTLDEDLQHPPSAITDLLSNAATASADVVYANARSGVHGAMVRDASSRWFKRLVARLSGNPHVRLFNSFRLIRGPIARGAASVCTQDSYFDIVLLWFTDRVGAHSLDLVDTRYADGRQSGYRLRTLLSHGRRMLVTSQVKVMRVGAALGLVATVLSLLAAVGLVIVKLIAPSAVAIQGWTSIIVIMTFLFGLVLMLLGILLEYTSTLVLRAHGKPLFYTVDRSTDRLLLRYFSNADAVDRLERGTS